MVDVDMFVDWFTSFFVLESEKSTSGQEENHILFLDTCSAYPGEDKLISDDGEVFAKVFPPNVTSIIQRNQRVLESLK